MSWDVWLKCDSCNNEIGAWNYTHNINPMIRAAADAAGVDSSIWPYEWKLPGPEGAYWLDQVIKELEARPGAYTAMNPENGWGSYETLLPVLREMRDAVPESPTTWSNWS